MSAKMCPICGNPSDMCTCGCCCPAPAPVTPPLTTPNYHLLMYRANDVTSWLINYNTTMMTIDKIMHSLALRTEAVTAVPEDLIETVEKLEEEVAALKSSTAELIISNGNLSTQVSNAMESLANVQQSVQSLIINTTALDTRMTTVETAVQNLQTNLAKMVENVNVLATRIGEEETKSAAMQEAIDALKVTVQTMQTEADALEARIESLETGQEATANAITAINTQLQDVSEKADNTETALSSLGTAVSGKLAAIDATKANLIIRSDSTIAINGTSIDTEIICATISGHDSNCSIAFCYVPLGDINIIANNISDVIISIPLSQLNMERKNPIIIASDICELDTGADHIPFVNGESRLVGSNLVLKYVIPSSHGSSMPATLTSLNFVALYN